MRGHIEQLPSGSWRLKVYGGLDGAGKKRWVRRTVVGDRRDAELALAELVLQVGRGDVPTDGSLTVAQALEHWLAWYRSQVTEKAWLTAEGNVRNHLVPAIGDMRLDKLRTHHVDRMLAGVTARKPTAKGRPPVLAPAAPATIARVHGVLSAALAQAVRWGWIARNPAADASPPSGTSPEIRPPDPEVAWQLLEAADTHDPAFGAWLRLDAASGARRGELVGVRWEDVDLERGQLVIRRAVIHGIDGLVVKDTKTRTARTIALGPDTVELLRRHRRALVEGAFAAGQRPTGFVWSPDLDGHRPMRPDGMTSRFRRVRAKVPAARGVRLHDLRHFAATQMLAGGVDVKTAAGRLGHDPVMLLRRYGHFLPAKDQEAAEVLERALRRRDGRAAGS